MSKNPFKTALFGYSKIETCQHLKNISDDYEELMRFTIHKNENEIKLLEEQVKVLEQDILSKKIIF